MSFNVTKLSTSALVDIATIFGVPGLSTLKEAWDQIVEEKVKRARDIIVQEIEEGDFKNIPQDELVSIIHRYLQASINGTAKLNLRILAKLIKGITQNNEALEPGIYARDFNRYSNILADLTYEELQVLATLQKFKIQNEKEQEMSGPQIRISQHFPENSHYYDKAKRWLSGSAVNIKKGPGWVETEHGKRIMSAEEFNAIATSLVRTGLVYMKAPTVTYGSGAEIVSELTPLFFKLTELVEFQSIFRNEE